MLWADESTIGEKMNSEKLNCGLAPITIADHTNHANRIIIPATDNTNFRLAER